MIQIKPQLENVLKLQVDSLTKEIKLTQNGTDAESLNAVKGHAQALQAHSEGGAEWRRRAQARAQEGPKRGEW